ncbi:vomeronasal type-2 receptor 26-like [Rhineura floridana]|uniref:vomeronasal type-2 receptor 26-like n=1 Tax=Rhineura floridana TaxID=261503 RepID=UPI002AC894D0|nr:vomeronasal type-2 receptor 26-like [Rhineura floridana]
MDRNNSYYPPDEIVLGHFFSLRYVEQPSLNFTESLAYSRNNLPLLKNFQYVLAFVFAVHEINENAVLLPNTTLGSRIYDNIFSASKTYWNILDILFTGQRNPPNYNCDREKKPLAIIGGLTSQNSIQMANILNVFKVPQLGYGFFDPRPSDKAQFPFFYQMVPNENSQYIGTVHLLKYFRWTWIGLLVPDDDYGQSVLWNYLPMLTHNNICIAFMEMMPTVVFPLKDRDDFSYKLARIYTTVLFTKANVILLYGNSHFFKIFQRALGYNELNKKYPTEKVWIRTAQWDLNTMDIKKTVPLTLNGSLSFRLHASVVPGFQDFLQTINPHRHTLYFLHEFWQLVFNCSFPSHSLYSTDLEYCTGEEKLESLPGLWFEMGMSGQSYNIYNAVYAVAHALHAMYSSRSKQKVLVDGGQWNSPNYNCDREKPLAVIGGLTSQHSIQMANILNVFKVPQLHSFLNNIRFNNSAGEEIFFHNMELASHYDIINWVTYPNQSFRRIQVGKIDMQTPEGKVFTINEDAILWNPSFNQTMPHSTCTESCHPGYRKILLQGKQVCCYSCALCPEMMISVQIDADHCEKCPEDQYPNKNRDQCIPKVITYLSYEEPLGIIVTSAALFLSLITLVVMWSFIQHRNTPIVKANNWSITCTLLTSLLFCFLSSFLYIGCPSKVICVLQQVVFSIVFSLAVTCIWSKTITVIVAFISSKPGNRMRKMVGKRLAVSVIILCTLIQTGFCVLKQAISPLSVEFDKHSQIGQIFAYCKAKSNVMMYYLLGYFGALAIISFTVAFFARNLPDSYNEAKQITLSMLMICSLWLSFLSTSLGTRVKSTLAVFVFYILASSAGLLSFIFLPKLYIILLRPQLNTREQLVRKKKSAI